MFTAELFIQTLIAGVMIGVLYALMALGITFIYSIVKMINWAMGEFYMIGSYLQYLLVAYLLLKGARVQPVGELKYRYLKWKIDRARKKFGVHPGGRTDDWDRRVH